MESFVRAPYRSINPFFSRRVERSRKKKASLAVIGGYTHYCTFFDQLRAGRVISTPLTVARLQRVADAVGFPRDQIFLDEVGR
jgi:hypothetical protein